MRSLIAACARNSVFANIVLIGILFAGVGAASIMIREMFPEFTIDMVTVQVVYPGADPEEVEEGICRKIEEAIDGLEGIKEYTTQAGEGFATASIEIIEGYNLSKAKDDIKTQIDAISTFPVDAERPVVSDITIRREVLTLALSGPLDERGLKEWAERVKDDLRLLPEISQVSISGTREYEISVEVSEESLREYGITFQQVADAIRRSNLNQAGGTVRTTGEEVRLRTLGRKYWGDEFREIIVLARPNGDVIKLGQIATVRDGFTEDLLVSELNDDPSVAVLVSNTKDEDAIAIARAVKRYVAETQPTLPPGVKMTIWNDMSQVIEARIRLLIKNGITGLALVFVLLWLFLDLRLSFWAALAIPVSLAGGIAILWTTGGTLNMMSLFGLIMVLGMVVDNAIVVGEAIFVHRKGHDSAMQAAINGASEVGMPILASVATTVLAFVPLSFISGVMGNFIAVLPVVVISALVVSLIQGLVILPAQLNHIPDPNDPARIARQQRTALRRLRRNVHDSLEWFVDHVYTRVLDRVMAWRYAAVCAVVASLLLTIGLFQGGFIKFVLFPPMDGNSLTATVEFPNGTPVEATRQALNQIEEALRRLEAKVETSSGDPLVKNVYNLVGSTFGARGGPRSGSGSVGAAQPHIGTVRVEMLESENRGIHSRRIVAMWEKEIGNVPGAISLQVDGGGGGPSSRPIEIWLQGENMNQLLAAADDLIAQLQQFEGVSQLESDFRPGKNEIRFALKPEARALGITVADLGRQVFAGYFGEEAMRLQRGQDDIRVRVRYPEGSRRELSDLDQVRIRTPQGDEVPLLSVAEASYGPGYSTITRVNGLRRVSVSAEVDATRANTAEINQLLQTEYVPQLLNEYPGMTVSFQGEAKQSGESLGSLAVGFPLALIGIFVIIATVFRSYAQPFIIMLTVPFGMVGAVFGHLAMGYPLTLMSMFGVVALAGVVVNNAIVMIECINGLLAEQTPFFDAVRNGAARRFRAIFLTTASTIGGLGPMVFERDMQARFLIPMALAISAGLAFASLLTLFIIPSMLGILNDLRRIARYLRTGAWPTPDEVEPATKRHVDLVPGRTSNANLSPEPATD